MSGRYRNSLGYDKRDYRGIFSIEHDSVDNDDEERDEFYRDIRDVSNEVYVYLTDKVNEMVIPVLDVGLVSGDVEQFLSEYINRYNSGK